MQLVPLQHVPDMQVPQPVHMPPEHEPGRQLTHVAPPLPQMPFAVPV
jgi:hypothetical protein